MHYVHHSLGSHLFMFFLVTQIHLLVFIQCSLVFDEANQEAMKNKYCSQVGDCLPGTHVMCMYGDQNIMGPRCGDGRPLPFQDDEKAYILDILNQFKRSLALGREKLPKAYGMRKLFWDDTLADFAQTWANQCDGNRLDLCRASEEFPRAGQSMAIKRYNYPDWSPPNAQIAANVAEPTPEKRRQVIEFYTGAIYRSNNLTDQQIQRHPSGGFRNTYLIAVYGTSTNVGCGMSTFPDYYRTEDKEPIIFHAVEIVCNFSSQPIDGEKVYETKLDPGAGLSPCGCPDGFIEEDCLCVRMDKQKGDKEKEERPLPKDDTRKGDNSKEKGDIMSEGTCAMDDPNCSPHVVIMPIITVENGDSIKHPLQGSQTPALTKQMELRKQRLRQKIKARVQNVRDRYFKEYVVLDPGTRFSNGGPIDEDTFVLSKQVPKPIPDRNRKELKLNFSTNKRRSNVEIKSRRDFSDLDDVVSEYLLNLHDNKALGSQTEILADQSIKDMRRSKPVNIQNSQNPNPQPFLNSEQDFRYNKYAYVGNDLEHLLSDLNTSEQNYNDFAVDKMATGKVIEDVSDKFNNLGATKKEMLKGDLMDNTDFTDFINYEPQIFEEQQNIWPKRNQNPLNTHDPNNNDYYLQFENDQGHREIEPQSMLIVDEYNGFKNDEKSLYEYSGGQDRPYVYDANEITHYYLDRLAPKPTHLTDVKSSKIQHHTQANRDEMDNQKPRYFVPDRLNLKYG